MLGRCRRRTLTFISAQIEVWIVGGQLDANALPNPAEPNVRVATYLEIIANARRQIDWLLTELANS